MLKEKLGELVLAVAEHNNTHKYPLQLQFGKCEGSAPHFMLFCLLPESIKEIVGLHTYDSGLAVTTSVMDITEANVDIAMKFVRESEVA